MRKFLIISSITLFMGGTAQAADLGQYRPGNPYQSVIAPGADVCQSHCAGDAQCRSWNYVKPGPQASGVCEFNANDVPPVSSAISISGSNSFGAYSRGVVAGGTNTIRVGTSPAYQSPTESRTQSSSNRRIVREAAPQQRQVQTASTARGAITPSQGESLTAQQNQYRQMEAQSDQRRAPVNQSASNGAIVMPQTFKYDLGGQSSNPRQVEQMQRQATRPQNPASLQNSAAQPYPPQSYAPQNRAPQYRAAPPVRQEGPVTRSDRRRQQGPSGQGVQRAQGNMAYQAQPAPQSFHNTSVQNQTAGQPYPPQGNYSPDNYRPESYRSENYAPQYTPQTAPFARRSATDPVTYGETTSPSLSASASNQTNPSVLAKGLSAEQAQQSLFGKLNDDVQVPNSGAMVPTDPNAPIPTMSSRASGTVEQSSLAGGPSQN
jgi:hypothetical protein